MLSPLCEVRTEHLSKKRRHVVEALLHTAAAAFPDWLRQLKVKTSRARNTTASVRLDECVHYQVATLFLHPDFWDMPWIAQVDAILHEGLHILLEPFYAQLTDTNRRRFETFEEWAVQQLATAMLDQMRLTGGRQEQKLAPEGESSTRVRPLRH